MDNKLKSFIIGLYDISKVNLYEYPMIEEKDDEENIIDKYKMIEYEDTMIKIRIEKKKIYDTVTYIHRIYDEDEKIISMVSMNKYLIIIFKDGTEFMIDT